MAGCECEVWKAIEYTESAGVKPALKYNDAEKSWALGGYLIDFCPWCGSKLTEEAGDVQEDNQD